MSFYERHILPRLLDKACGIGPITKQRQKIIPHAEGIVLEIGIGSGLNLPHYNSEKVSKIIGVDPDEHIWKRSEARRKACPIDVERIGLSGEDIPLETNMADSVVVTYSLCTIPDPVKALGEMTRILKPGGRIYFSEHGQAPDAEIKSALFKKADLKFDTLEEMYVPGPKVLSYNYWGVAKPS